MFLFAFPSEGVVLQAWEANFLQERGEKIDTLQSNPEALSKI